MSIKTRLTEMGFDWLIGTIIWQKLDTNESLLVYDHEKINNKAALEDIVHRYNDRVLAFDNSNTYIISLDTEIKLLRNPSDYLKELS